MIKKFLLSLLISGCTAAYAQTIKTDVVVIGGGASGVAAGIQAARSNVKALIVEQGPWLGGSMTAGGNCIVDANRNLPSGIWGEFRKHVRDFYKKTPGFDTSANAALRFEPYTGAAILKKITDTVKHLTVKLNTPWTAIKKNGDGWELTITEKGKPVTIKAQVVIDATETGDVAAAAGAKFNIGFDSKKTTGEVLAPDEALPIIQEITWIAVVKDYGAAEHIITKPEGYNAAGYACLKGKDAKKMLADGKLPNDKYMIKWGECANSFPVTMNDLLPENRDTYYAKVKQHTLGLVYFLETEMGLKNIGIDPKEFGSTDGLPYIPYIREARRAIGVITMTMNEISTPYDNASKLYRTSIGVGDASPGQHFSADAKAPKIAYPPMPGYSIPMGAVMVKDIDNLLVTEKAMATTHLVNASSFYPSVQMSLGQGAGTVAAYCAFFKITTKNIRNKVRDVQIELLTYKGYIMPFIDVDPSDHFFRAIQQVGATGMLKGVQKTTGKTSAVYFLPDSTVQTSEIKPIMLDLYTRAFLWFNKTKPAEEFTVGNMLSYISEMTLSDPQTLNSNMQKYWKTRFKFTSTFDTARPITRREFAALANTYINPFARTVDITGRFVN